MDEPLIIARHKLRLTRVCPYNFVDIAYHTAQHHLETHVDYLQDNILASTC